MAQKKSPNSSRSVETSRSPQKTRSVSARMKYTAPGVAVLVTRWTIG